VSFTTSDVLNVSI